MRNSPKKKKILFITRLFHPHIGGVEKHVYKMSQKLIERGYKVTVITEQYDKSLPLAEEQEGIYIKRIPIRRSEGVKKFEIWKWVIKNAKLVSDFDVIHVHDVFYWLLPIIIGLKKRKLFITFHGYEGYPVKLKQKMLRKVAEESCQGNICVGDFMKKWYGTKPDHITYGAVEKPSVEGNNKKKDLSAYFFGRLDGQTGIKKYYSAFKKIKSKYENFDLKVVGEGRDSSILKDIEVSPFSAKAESDISSYRFIFVSRYLSMLEAMIQKRIVIAVYDNPIKRDYLLNSPFKDYVEVCKTPQEIYEKVKYYIDNPKKEEEKVQKAYEWAKEQTWDNLVSTYQSLWEK